MFFVYTYSYSRALYQNVPGYSEEDDDDGCYDDGDNDKPRVVAGGELLGL